MAAGRPSEVIQGGGAEALVFRGCAEEGCGSGEAVVAADMATGAAFVAIRDAGGTDELVPNEKVAALLRLNSPTRTWQASPPAP